MKTLTAIDAQIQIIETIKKFQEMLSNGHAGMSATIPNVEFTELISLFKWVKSSSKMLVLPGEYGNDDKFLMIYWPIPNARIAIESTPAKKLVPKINIINYN